MTIFTYKKLYLAYLDCRKNKRKTANALKFEYNLEENLTALLNELKNKTYRPGRSICFIVKEPKPREIFAADFRDRIVHHLFVRELIAYAEKIFIYDSCACRVDKGTHFAVKRLQGFIKKAAGRGNTLFYLQLDISAFFPSISQSVLFGLIQRMIFKINKAADWVAEMHWLADKIIFYDAGRNFIYKGDTALKGLIPPEKSLFSRPPGVGLPIGNYTSQFFANVYLNEADQFIKHQLKCRYYIRYVDDLILLGDEKNFIDWTIRIGNFIKKELKLSLNKKKIKIKPVAGGLDFLGYFIKENYSLVRRKIIGRLNKKFFSKSMPKEKLSAVIASYFGHFTYADSWRLRTKYAENQLTYIFN